AGVTVSSPGNGSSLASPVHFVAKATASTSTARITAIQIYVDNVRRYSTSSTSLDTSLSIAAGTHNVVVQAWDSKGTVYKAPLTISVQSAPPPTIPATAKVFALIEDLTGWHSCDVCAGA